MSVKRLALVSIYASLYVVMVLALSFMAYGVVNIRLANALLGAVPFLGWVGVAGQTLGCVIANTISPLGFLDMINVIPTFAMTFLIWKLKSRNVLIGLTAYAVVTSVSIAALLSYLFGMPYLLQYGFVLIGQIIACVIGGFFVNKSLGKILHTNTV